LNHPTNR